MPMTGLFFIPAPPTSNSPCATLISHVSRKFPAQPLAPYILDHRLFFDTSSLLPGADVAKRRYLQILGLSHLPGNTFLGIIMAPKDGSAPPPNAGISIITVAKGSPTENFWEMTTKKMQPLFTPRQNIRVDNGTALELKDGDWRIRVGEAKMAGKMGQGSVKGVVVEIQYCGEDVETQEADAATRDWTMQEQILRAFFDAVVRDSDIGLDGLQVVVKVPGVREKEPSDWILVRQYMELLRMLR